MTTFDEFWRLENCEKIDNQDAFYKRLEDADHLDSVLYVHSRLGRESSDHVTRIVGVEFKRVSFSKTTIRNLIFRNCTFDRCQFIGSKLNNCEFHNCKFIMTNTHKISIASTYIDPHSFRKCLDKKRHQNIGVHLYQSLLQNSRDLEQIEFERGAIFVSSMEKISRILRNF
ncbi:MAG: hypothetical protein GY798_20010 [Hyphomicrobiales bacterium]|nr:hypothetical protein [Hyphomicrobiales bacterium]